MPLPIPPYTLIERLLFPPTTINENKLLRCLEGKTVLITGASSGIGEQLAYTLADAKAHLILTARREDKLLAVKREIEKRQAAQVSVYRADLREEAEREGLLEFIRRQPHAIDIVVSNAGHSIQRSIYDSLDRFHDFTRTMAINYFAPVHLLLSLIPLLERNQGHIVNVSTINALMPPFPSWAAYQASKAAFDVWFRSVSPELNRRGILTTTFYLPLVRTPMIVPTAEYRRMPAMSPQHVARLIGRSFYTRRKAFKPWWRFGFKLASRFVAGAWKHAASQKNSGKREEL
ncbi:SDR family NAD(P)-dependent oxidoreductase [Paenibacillus koleovorans]|uniref:SDR family NAD(P)-dependent oxidoreductase n=1 Tax=Paenibacillus koleovorans TaxID=121608 RepID=UPI001FE317CF|nr:SDR family NAD(P)-dependent oxidoreductase [Paenibacillus koleovorans]